MIADRSIIPMLRMRKTLLSIAILFAHGTDISVGFSLIQRDVQTPRNSHKHYAKAMEKPRTLRLSASANDDFVVDSYDPSVKGGCVKNMENHIRLLDNSLTKSRGAGMFDWINEKLQAEGSRKKIKTALELDMDTRFGVLSHGTQSDPVYNYGNQASLILFEQTIDNLCKTPSRFSTVPELMDDRKKLIEQIETRGYGYIDNAIRISDKGNLFMMETILVWTVFDDDDQRIGLAAIYDISSTQPYEDQDGRYKG